MRYDIGDPDGQVTVINPEHAAADFLGDGHQYLVGQHLLLLGDPDNAAYAIPGTPAGLRAFIRRLGRLLDDSVPASASPAGEGRSRA